MYPPGWCHRKFFAPRQSGNPAKQARKDDGIVQEVIKEQQLLKENQSCNIEEKSEEQEVVPSPAISTSRA